MKRGISPNWGEKEIGYQGTSDSCPGSYFDGIQVKESFSPVVYTHENIQVGAGYPGPLFFL